LFNFESTLRAGGILALAAIGLVVFGETGLLIGVILPGGDTTLLLAGSFAATGDLPLLPLIAVVVVSTFIGDNFGYEIGKRTGKKIFHRKESIIFDPEHLLRAEKFYEKHGAKTVVLARFIPVVRTFAPLIAGAGSMPRRRFVAYDAIGAVLWGAGVIIIGYMLASIVGERISDLKIYLLIGVGISMTLAFAPALYQLYRVKIQHKRLKTSKKVKEELDDAAEDIEKVVKD